jgi:hypothetical protein
MLTRMRPSYLLLFVSAACSLVSGQDSANTTPAAKAEISGKILSGRSPLPGVAVTASNSITGRKYVTSTDVDGSFDLPLPAFGRYVVRAEFAGFAPQTKEVIVNSATPQAKAELELTLQSRVAPPAGEEAAANAVASAVQSGRGIHGLSVTNADPGSLSAPSATGEPGAGTTPGVNADLSSESVSIAGNMGQTAPDIDAIRNQIEDMRDRAQLQQLGGPGNPGAPGGPGNPSGAPGGNTTFGGAGGTGGGSPMIVIGGPGGFGGGGHGGGGGGGRGGMRGFDMNQPHGTIYYQFGDSGLNAEQYSLNGFPSANPAYQQNNFGALLGGPLKIPHVVNDSNTFYFFNWTGARSTTPFSAYATVPTAAERAGDFSQLPTPIIDPATGQPFAGNIIPSNRITGASAALLNYFPLPNQPASNLGQNYHAVYTGANDSDQINLRLIHNFGSNSSGPGGIGMMMTPFGGMNRSGGKTHHNVNFALAYNNTNSAVLNVFPTLGGTSQAHNINASGGYTLSRGRTNFNIRITYNRGESQMFNHFAGNDIEQKLGINGVSTDPANFGLPNISLGNLTSLSDVAPADSDNQLFSVAPTLRWRRGKHNASFGGEYHRNFLTLDTGGNARGTFVFSGFATGNDLADFLLGIPQQTSIQTIQGGAYHFRANNFSLYAQDDWRVRGNLTINVGLRYEYAGPYYEMDNRLVNLVPNPAFTGVTVVMAGQPDFSNSLVRPDRNNWAPRIGIAWKPIKNTVVRAGYGINYNLGQYNTLVQQLAMQPPFAVTGTNIYSSASPLSLQNGFPVAANSGLITNNYAVNPNYRLGYVQNWTLDIQRELPFGMVMNLTYQGAKGTHLDVLTAPNRTPTGLLIPNVESFLYETSIADSIYNGGSLRIRKRMKNGFSIGGTYTYSKSLDDASSIGGGTSVVAQNPQDIKAEWGLSSFDQRQKLAADFYYELPFGPNKSWLHGDSWYDHALSNVQVNGTLTLGTGNPFTPRFLNNQSTVATGVTGTLRPNLTGEPISGPQTASEWFNVGAFSTTAPVGSYGDAGRDIIEGPGTFTLNMSVSKSIQFEGRKRLEFGAQGTNILNHVNYASIGTIVNSPTFGTVTAVGAMRTITLQMRYNF